MSEELLEKVRDYWKELDYCGCYSPEIQEILERATKAHYFIESVNDEDTGWTVVEAPDGFWTFHEFQDYTGHGCRCGSGIGAGETGPFKDLETAIRLGLDREGRKSLGLA